MVRPLRGHTTQPISDCCSRPPLSNGDRPRRSTTAIDHGDRPKLGSLSC
ncbi:hypothetical protein [Prochlorothrix hollandica]